MPYIQLDVIMIYSIYSCAYPDRRLNWLALKCPPHLTIYAGNQANEYRYCIGAMRVVANLVTHDTQPKWCSWEWHMAKLFLTSMDYGPHWCLKFKFSVACYTWDSCVGGVIFKSTCNTIVALLYCWNSFKYLYYLEAYQKFWFKT